MANEEINGVPPRHWAEDINGGAPMQPVWMKPDEQRGAPIKPAAQPPRPEQQQQQQPSQQPPKETK